MKNAFLCGCFLLAWPLVTNAQGTMRTIGFEGPPFLPPTNEYRVDYYFEGDMLFTSLPGDDGFGRAGGGREGFAQNGSAYLFFAFTYSLRGRMLYDQSFGLKSVDLAEFSTLYPFPVTIPFIGYKADASTVTNRFTTDGIIGVPKHDFETFYFDDQFSDIVRFDVPFFGYSLDNLVISTIPEPGFGGLAIAGLLTLGWARGRAKGRIPVQIIGTDGSCP